MLKLGLKSVYQEICKPDFNESSLIIQLVKVVKAYSLEAVVRLIELDI